MTKHTWSHSGSKSVWYLGELPEVALYMQVTRVQRVGTPQSLVDGACDCLFYAIPFYSRRTILSPVTYPSQDHSLTTLILITCTPYTWIITHPYYMYTIYMDNYSSL